MAFVIVALMVSPSFSQWIREGEDCEEQFDLCIEKCYENSSGLSLLKCKKVCQQQLEECEKEKEEKEEK